MAIHGIKWYIYFRFLKEYFVGFWLILKWKILKIIFSKKKNIRFLIITIIFFAASSYLFLLGNFERKTKDKWKVIHKIADEDNRDNTKNVNLNIKQINYNNPIVPPKYLKNRSMILPFEFYSTKNRKENEILPRGLNLNEYEKIMSLVEILVKILTKNNMEYFIGYGTQLGKLVFVNFNSNYIMINFHL
jgi:hypothetical protein